MKARSPETLYDLLPPILRSRDLDAGEPLRALMLVLERVFDTVQGDIDGLYDDLFVETCRTSLLPYLGDAVGAHLRTDDDAAVLRAFVADVVALRRRMGTLGAIERAATDLTGWPARALEPRAVLRTTLALGQARPGPNAVVDLRDAVALAQRGGPFDTLPRSLDLGRAGAGPSAVAQGIGMPNQLGLYLWRLPIQPLERVVASNQPPDPEHTTAMCFSVCSVPRVDLPLFRPPVTRPEDGSRLGPNDYPTQLRLDERWDGQEVPVRLWLQKGSDPGLLTPVDPGKVVVRDLAAWAHGDVGDAQAAVDVERGRIMLLGSQPKALRVSFAAAGLGDLGGGSYPRPGGGPGASFVVYRVGPFHAERLVLPEDPKSWVATTGLRGEFQDLAKALARYASDGKPAQAWFELVDSGTYALSGWTRLDLSGRTLVIRAAPGERPTILGDLAASATGGQPGKFQLDGLLWGGRLGLFGALNATIRHCTIKPTGVLTEPPPEQVTKDPSAVLTLHITHSIVGAIRAGRGQAHLVIEDSVVDGSRAYGFGVSSAVTLPRHAAASAWIGLPDGAFALRGPDQQDESDSAAGPPTELARTTVLGEVDVASLSAVDALFEARVTVRERFQGTLSHCYLPRGSTTPPRVRCVDDRVQDTANGGRMPMFESVTWPEPGYAWLRRTSSPAVRKGASNGSEMGAMSSQQISAREDRLARSLEVMVPLSLRAAVVYVT